MDEASAERLRDAVGEAAKRPDVGEAVARVYADLAAQVEQRRPVCVASGRCCRFEEYGHRLFVTTIELAAFVSQMAHREIPRWDGTGCPFQAGKLCGVHAIRPFGCRVFFCDAGSIGWQNDLYEQLHGRIKRLHEELGVPYFYVEWRAALATVLNIRGAVEGRTSL